MMVDHHDGRPSWWSAYLSKIAKKRPPEEVFRLGRSFLQIRLKRVFPKFHANRSHPRGVKLKRSFKHFYVSKKCSPDNLFGLRRSFLQNRLKRVSPKFHTNRSHPRGVNGLSKLSNIFEKSLRQKKLRLGRSNLQNRLKRILPKFHADRSHPRGVNDLSKFSIFSKI